MLEPGLFEYLDKQARRSLKQPRVPFGGMQLVLCGDYFQLPPVSKDRNSEKAEFIFELPLYQAMDIFNVELRQVFRQKDQEFV